MNFIHKTADVSKKAKLGKKTFVWNNAQIRENVVVGENCILAKGVYIDKGCIIGSNVKIQNYTSLFEKVILEDGVFVGPYVCFTNDKYPRAVNLDGSLKKESDWTKGVTKVGKGASVGAGVIVLPGLTIGEFAMIGAGSVVRKDVGNNQIVIGNPSRVAGYICRCGNVLTKGKTKPKILLCKKCSEEIVK